MPSRPHDQALRLYDQPTHPDAAHNVRAPGGYEWWYFDAEDPQTDTQIVAIFLHGFIFHPGYLRAYKKFQKHPTRHAPPLPGDYPCAYLVVYQHGRIAHQFMTQYPRDQYDASPAEVQVKIGPNQLIGADSYRLSMSGTPWKLTFQGPKTLHGQTLGAELSFSPTHRIAPVERTFLSRAMTGADHHWVIAAPRCDVHGTIRAGDQTIPFTGVGYHDHNYGSGPIGQGLARWAWGRAIVGQRVMTFHYAIPTDDALPLEFHLIEVGPGGVREVTANPIVDWNARTGTGLRYPTELDFGPMLQLSHPRVVDASPFYLRVIYRATSLGETSTAFCEVAYPHRLRWPVLGRMIEMSIDKQGGSIR